MIVKKVFHYVISLTTFLVLSSSPVMAQGDAAPAAGGDSDLLTQSWNDMIAVTAFGGVGAVLGLSTLSFVEEPKDNFKNIVVGAALGVIIGVGVVAWLQANKSQRAYKDVSDYKSFSTGQRLAWHHDSHTELNTKTPAPFNTLNLNLSF